MFDRAVGLGHRGTENLQRLVLRRGGEREVTGVGQEFACLHDPVHHVLKGLCFGFVLGSPAGTREYLGHRRGRSPALA